MRTDDMEHTVCGVTFRVRALMQSGEKVTVVGSCPSLGSWDPKNGVTLSTTPDSYPLWFTPKPIYIPMAGVRYKYVVTSEGREPRYEAFDGVRPLTSQSRELMVDDVMDLPGGAGVVPWDPTSETAGASLAPVEHAGRVSDSVGASLAGPSHGGAATGVAGASGVTSAGHVHGEGVARAGVSIAGTGAGATAGAKRQKEKPSLDEHDGVLIVQYCLPVKLYKRGGAHVAAAAGDGEAGAFQSPKVMSSSTAELAQVAGGSATPGAASIPRDPFNGWVAEWDEEALLAPKGGMVRALRSVRVKWIGTCPVEVEHGEEEAVTRLLETMNCIPVFLPPATHKAFYDGYCRDTLWPVFHNVNDVYGQFPTRWWLKDRQADRWKAYMDANGKFAVTVVENFHEGDLVWIQDFHLLLVPNLLARRHIAPTALFLHTPFPSSEIFRTLSVRDELLRGMLSADHIGFHLFEYARHFLTSCRRILGLTHTVKKGGSLTVEYQGREVLITISHVGVEPSHLLSCFKAAPATVLSAAGWRSRFPGAKIVAGIDSIERLKGVPLKLRAWEAFLASHPEDVGSAVLVQICVKDSMRPGDNQEASHAEIVALADRINARFGRPNMPAVHLDIRSSPVQVKERVALWAAADVLVNTSIRDALTLFPFEYSYIRGASECLPEALEAAAAKVGTGRPDAELAAAAVAACNGGLASLNPGILILSEFTGGSRVLFGALKVNPWKVAEVVAAIAHALHVSDEEAAARAESCLQYVRGNTTAAWAERVLLDLKSVSSRGGAGRTYMGYGLGLGYRLMGLSASFRPLNTEHVLTAYRRATHRLFVFDYGGTLNVKDSGEVRQKAFEMGLLHGKDAAPPLTAETKKALRILSEDPRNTVFVVSGKEKDVLAQAFASLPHVGLAAEHGFYFRWGAPPIGRQGRAVTGSGTNIPRLAFESGADSPASGGSGGARDVPATLVLPGSAVGDNGQAWETCVPYVPMDEWKSLAGTIMEMYAARTNGTFILRKGSAVSWHYSDADPEFGSLQAKELQDHLTGVLGGYGVDVLSGQGYVEVRPRGVDKGAVLEIIVNRLEGRARPGGPPQSGHVQGQGLIQANSAGKLSTASSASNMPTTPVGFSHHVASSHAPDAPPAPDSSGRPAAIRTAPLIGPQASALHAPGSGTPAPATPALLAMAHPCNPGGGYNLSTSPGGSGGAPPVRTVRARPLEFILCIGDDLADEEMFTTVQRVRQGRMGEHSAALARARKEREAVQVVVGGGSGSMPDLHKAMHKQGADASIGTLVPTPVKAGGTGAGLQIGTPISMDSSSAVGPQPGGGASAAGAGGQPTLTYYEYTVTVGKKPSAAQYFLDDTQQTEDVLRSIARVAAKSRSTAASAAAASLGAGSALAASSGAASAATGGRGLTGLAVQQSFASRTAFAGGSTASFLRPGPSAGLFSMPAELHKMGAAVAPLASSFLGQPAHPVAFPNGPSMASALPSPPPPAFAVAPYPSSGHVGAAGGFAGAASFALPGGTYADLSSYLGYFAGSTTNIAGLNTNILEVVGGGSMGAYAPAVASFLQGAAHVPSGRPLGQLPFLPNVGVSSIQLAGGISPANGSPIPSPSGSASGLGGVARTVAVSPGNPFAMAGLLAGASYSSSVRLASLAAPLPALLRVAEGESEGDHGEGAGEEDRGFSSDTEEERDREGNGMPRSAVGRQAREASSLPPSFLSQSSVPTPDSVVGAEAGQGVQGMIPVASMGGLGGYFGSIAESNAEDTMEF